MKNKNRETKSLPSDDLFEIKREGEKVRPVPRTSTSGPEGLRFSERVSGAEAGPS